MMADDVSRRAFLAGGAATVAATCIPTVAAHVTIAQDAASLAPLVAGPSNLDAWAMLYGVQRPPAASATFTLCDDAELRRLILDVVKTPPFLRVGR